MGDLLRTFGVVMLGVEDFSSVGRVGEEEEGFSLRAVMRVLTTQIGFVIRTVAEPARAPASMDSTVVSLEERRVGWRRARRSKKERDHSYPRLGLGWWTEEEREPLPGSEGQARGRRTVIVYEIGDADAKESGLEARVEALDAFPLYDAPSCVERGRVGASGLDLGAGRERDERVSSGCF